MVRARVGSLGAACLQPLPALGGRVGRVVLPGLRLLQVLLQRRRLRRAEAGRGFAREHARGAEGGAEGGADGGAEGAAEGEGGEVVEVAVWRGGEGAW